MRLTLITIGSRGDIQPFIPLALGLQSAGHTVRIVTHRPYEAYVRGYNLDFYPLVGDPQELMQGESGLAWLETGRSPVAFLRQFRDLAVEMMEQLGRDCWAACQDAEVILFSTLGFFTGVPIAEKLGIPGIATYLQPLNVTTAFPSIVFPELPEGYPLRAAYNRLTHDLTMEMNWWLFRKAYNHLRTGLLKLPPATESFRFTINQPYPIVYGYSPHVLPPPPDWGQHICVSGYWFLDANNWQPPAELVNFLDSGPPPVYVGFGSMTHRDSEQLTDLVLAAIQKSGQRAILLSGWAGIGSRCLPDTIFGLEYAPHDWLFPRVAAVVHHGGAGTTAAGLRVGAPSVVVPHFADQPFWAQRVAALGVGPLPIPQKRLTADRLAYAIHVAVTHTAMRRRAADLGAKIRAENGVATAVRRIQEVLRESAK